MAPVQATFAVQLDVKLPEKTDAETGFEPLERYEAPWARRGFPTFRFSLVEARPVTGRRHQIRQHCDDLRHPIFGDTVWGDTGMNGWLSGVFAGEGRPWGGLHLWCQKMVVPHPDGGGPLTAEAAPGPGDRDRLAWYRTFAVSGPAGA